ncbi:MAG: single-stranded-DNA-specific exonuclease RecJ, partial [Candidatus Nephrothrix sp. EaCA]
MQRKWIYAPLPPVQEWETFSKLLNINTPLTGILWQRGIQNVARAQAFFRPSFQQLHDPFLMKNMEAAVARLKKAIDEGEKILIYGDYDVDGTTSVALVYSYLKTFHAHCSFYVPDRYSEGYGISFEGVKWAAQHNHTLIIALDVGIKSMDKVKFASERGIDFIICDHHLPDEEVPTAVAVLDPKQSDCNYPFKELSGCGLGFKLIQAFAKKHRDEEEVFQYLDLVTVSICSDIVPLVEENRVLVHFG